MNAHTSPLNTTATGNVHPQSLFTLKTDALPWGVRPLFLLALASLAYILHAAIDAPSWDAGGAWIWFVALFIAGMPHGAYDLATIHRISQSTRQTIRRFTLYTIIMIVCTALLLALPTIATIAFLMLAAHHFGISDSVWTRARIPTLRGHLIGLSHGIVILTASFAFQPADAWAPFAHITAIFPHASALDPIIIAPIAGALLAIGLIATVAASIFVPQPRNHLLEQWSVIAAMLAISALLPPLAAVGVYFLVVHASGHCLRADLPGKPAPRIGLANFLRVHRDSLPLLFPSIAIVIAGAALFTLPFIEAIALSFIFFCVIATLPHHLLWLGWFAPRTHTST